MSESLSATAALRPDRTERRKERGEETRTRGGEDARRRGDEDARRQGHKDTRTRGRRLPSVTQSVQRAEAIK
ncbi:uncharacterized protein V6R79_018382 [Siganus canaliculatus]